MQPATLRPRERRDPAARLTGLPARAYRLLRGWPWAGTLLTLLRRFREDRLALTAGSLTFTSVISMVPLATVVLAVFSAFPMFGTLQEALQRYLVTALVPDNIAKQLLGYVTLFSSRANRLGIFGLVALIVSSLALMLTIDRTLNSIWRVRAVRPIGQRVLVYWSALTLGPLFVAVSLAATSFALTTSRGWIGDLPEGFGFLIGAVDFVFIVIGMSALFHYVPNTHVHWRHAVIGGIVVGLGFTLVKRLLAWWFGYVPTYSMLYGAFAMVPIFLVWMYLVWCIVLVGAVIAAYAPVARMKVSRWSATAGSRFHLAVSILRMLDRARLQGTPGLTSGGLSAALATDPLQTEPMLEALVAIDWVGRLDENGDPRHVLLRDPASTPAEPLIASLLLDPAPDIGPFWAGARFDQLMLADVLREPS